MRRIQARHAIRSLIPTILIEYTINAMCIYSIWFQYNNFRSVSLDTLHSSFGFQPNQMRLNSIFVRLALVSNTFFSSFEIRSSNIISLLNSLITIRFFPRFSIRRQFSEIMEDSSRDGEKLVRIILFLARTCIRSTKVFHDYTWKYLGDWQTVEFRLRMSSRPELPPFRTVRFPTSSFGPNPETFLRLLRESATDRDRVPSSFEDYV